MNLARKVQKLFTAEAIESLFDHAKRWSHPVDEQKIFRGIDRKAWDDLRARYPQKPDTPRINRFSDVDHWLKINIERAQDLWLDRSPPLRILDLGCGPGYFLHVCKQLGHEGVGVDIDEQAVAASAANARLNGVAAAFLAVDALPAGATFDVVVANILANPLRVLAPALCRRTAAGGSIALAGILVAQADDVVAAYARWFDLRAWRIDDDWVLLAGRRHPTANAGGAQ